MTGKTDKKLERLFFWGRPFSPLYGFIMKARAGCFLKGLCRRHRFEVPVISVGNLVLGGTGKTPLVQYIARFLQKQDIKPAVLSRGYRGTASGPVNVVSSPNDIRLNAVQAGDEPRLLAESLPGVPVITGKKRFLTGRYAIDEFGAEALILDDGFQHLAVYRDLDLVLFRGAGMPGNGRVLPGGDLREPLSALQRATAFIVTEAGSLCGNDAEQLTNFLGREFPDKPLFRASYIPKKSLLKYQGGVGSAISRSEVDRISLFAFCGIAGPDSFRKTLRQSGIKLTGFREFADHHDYSGADIRSLIKAVGNSGADGLVTTEKDLVKLRSQMPPEALLYVVPVQLVPTDDFCGFLTDTLAAFNTSQPLK